MDFRYPPNMYQAKGLAEPGEIVKLVPPAGTNIKDHPSFVQLGAYENLTTYKFGKVAVKSYKFGQIAAGADKDIQVITDMQPHEDHISQLRFGIHGPCQAYLNIPSNLNLGGIDTKQQPGSAWRELGYYDQWNSPPYNYSTLTEHWFTWHFYPAFRFFNPTKTPQSPEISFVGRIFEFERVSDQSLITQLRGGQRPYRYAPLGGIEKTAPK